MTVADFPSTQAVAYHDGQCQGKVASVLGAGNVSSLGRAYLLYKLFVENQVVLFKANPVNAHLGPRVIIHHAARKQRDSLLQRIGDVFAQVSLRSAYYPGARDRFAAFVAAHPDALLFGQPSGDKLPWTLISSVDPSKDAYIVFTTEAFCGLFAETSLEAPSVAGYIDRAVAFCNATLWGTLNATILVHPASLKDPAVADAIDRAIANLRYGTIGVNEWPAAAYILGEMPWGGFPGSDIYDIQYSVGHRLGPQHTHVLPYPEIRHSRSMARNANPTILREPAWQRRQGVSPAQHLRGIDFSRKSSWHPLGGSRWLEDQQSGYQSGLDDPTVVAPNLHDGVCFVTTAPHL